MSLVPRMYSSTDPGAPALTGQVGSLVGLLDAVLVDGYGSGGSAMPGAGWTREFSAPSVRAYRNNPVTSSGGFLRVDDSATIAGSNARAAIVRAFESMSAIDVGTGPGPTPAQRAAGLGIFKSRTLDASPSRWVAFACERFFYLFVNPGIPTVGWTEVSSFPTFAGDIKSRKPGDSFNFGVAASTTATGFSGAITDNAIVFFANATFDSTSAINTGAYLLRAATGVPGAVGVQAAMTSIAGTSLLGSRGVAYPDVVSAGLLYERIALRDGSGSVRGYLPNAYVPLHVLPFADLEVIPGVQTMLGPTDLLSKWYVSQTHIAQAGSWASLLFDLANEW